jgi:hypothetical protein
MVNRIKFYFKIINDKDLSQSDFFQGVSELFECVAKTRME